MELPYISQPDWGDFMQILEDCYRSLHNDRTTRIPNAGFDGERSAERCTD